jgi:predicted nucleotidyltransferase
MATTVFEVRDGRALWDGRTLSDWTGSIVADLVATFNPVEIWLFGSVARDEDHRDSDLDLLVVLDTYSPRDAIALKLKANARVSAPVPFDVVFSDPRRLSSRRLIAGTIERAVSLDGRRLYERD